MDLPILVHSYNGGCESDDETLSIQNILLRGKYDPPHCSKAGTNVDLVLKFSASSSSSSASTCTLTHVVIGSADSRCSSPLTKGILFLSTQSNDPQIEQYTSLYNNCTQESFNSISEEERQLHGAVQYFTIDSTERETILSIPFEQSQNITFIHLKLISGLETNIDLGQIKCIGYPSDQTITREEFESVNEKTLEEARLVQSKGAYLIFHPEDVQHLFNDKCMLIRLKSTPQCSSEKITEIRKILRELPAVYSSIIYMEFEDDDLNPQVGTYAEALRTFLGPIPNSPEEVAGYNLDDDPIRIVLLDAPVKIKRIFDAAPKLITALPTDDDHPLLALHAFITSFILESTAAHAEEEGEEQNAQEEAGDYEEEEEGDDTTSDPFLKVLRQFAAQTSAGMLITCVRVLQPTTVKEMKEQFRENQQIFNMIHQFMGHYFDGNWTQTQKADSEDRDSYICETIDTLMSFGYFQHPECLYQFLFEYCTVVIVQSVALLLDNSRMMIALSSSNLSPEEFLDAIRSIIYQIPKIAQKDQECIEFASQENLVKFWSCSESCARFLETNEDDTIMQFIEEHFGEKRQITTLPE
jgi:hypothetical protein